MQAERILQLIEQAKNVAKRIPTVLPAFKAAKAISNPVGAVGNVVLQTQPVQNFTNNLSNNLQQQAREIQTINENARRQGVGVVPFTPILANIGNQYPQLPNKAEAVARKVPDYLGSKVGLKPESNWASNVLGGLARSLVSSPPEVLSGLDKLKTGTPLTDQERNALNQQAMFMMMGSTGELSGYNKTPPSIPVTKTVPKSLPSPKLAAELQLPKQLADPLEALKVEARKYKSAEEFVKAQGQPIYHGTKSDFTEFDFKKIGTNEGVDEFGNNANIFGDALYLTNNKDVADFYAYAAAKRDFIAEWKYDGILGTSRPIFKPNADELAKNNKKIVEAYTNGKMVDTESIAVEGKLKDKLIDEAYKSDPQMPKEWYTKKADMLLQNYRKPNSTVAKRRGEYMYVMDHMLFNDKNALNNMNDYFKKQGYSGFKYKSDPRYEGGGSYNYAIFDLDKVKTKQQLTDLYNQSQLPTQLPAVSKGLKFDLESAGGEKRLVVDLFPDESIRGKGITKNETLKAFDNAYKQGHKIVEPSNGMWTKDGWGFIKHLEDQGYVKQIPNRGGIERFEILNGQQKIKGKNPIIVTITKNNKTSEYRLKDFADKDGYVYHTTSPNNIESIKESGLRVSDGYQGKAVYFAPDEASTIGQASYDGATIRVNINKLDAKNVTSADVNGFGEPTELVYANNIPPSAIEVKTKNGWQPIVSGDIKNQPYFRYADDSNKITDVSRGGTWFTNEGGGSLIKDAMNPKYVSEVSIGGNKVFNLGNKPKNPLVINDALLEDGSFAVINNGYESYLPKKYRDVANNLYDSIHDDMESLSVNEIDRIIMDALYDAGIPEKQARNVLGVLEKNKFDAAMDLIISKGLKENGYDALLLKDKDAEHLFTFNTTIKKPPDLIRAFSNAK